MGLAWRNMSDAVRPRGVDSRRTFTPAETILAVQLACLPVVMVAYGFAYDWPRLAQLALGATGLLLAHTLAERRQWESLAQVIRLYFTLVSSCICISQISIVLASTSSSLIDGSLAALDRRLFGITWEDVGPPMAREPVIAIVLSLAYNSLSWQPFVLLGLFILRQRHRDAKQLLVAWLLATSISVIVFPFAPALGGYLHLGYERDAFPHVLVGAAWDFAPVLSGARDGSLRMLGETPAIGLVTFPSFHAAGGLILGWFGLRVRGGWAFALLNALMIVSTIPIGGHYLIDVVAGLALAVVVLALVSWLHRTSDRDDGIVLSRRFPPAATSEHLIGVVTRR